MNRAPQLIQYRGYTYRRADRRARIISASNASQVVWWQERVQQMFDALKQPKPKRIAVDLGITPRYPLVDVTMADKATAATVYKFLRRRGWKQVELSGAVLKLKLNPDWPMIA